MSKTIVVGENQLPPRRRRRQRAASRTKGRVVDEGTNEPVVVPTSPHVVDAINKPETVEKPRRRRRRGKKQSRHKEAEAKKVQKAIVARQSGFRAARKAPPPKKPPRRPELDLLGRPRHYSWADDDTSDDNS